MKRESSGDEGSDHSGSFTPPYYPQQHQQQQQQQPEEELFYTPLALGATSAKTMATATTAAQPLYAFQSIATSPNMMAIPPVVLPMTMPSSAAAVNSSNSSGGMDDMDHWLVDICAQLGSADDDAAVAAQTTDVRLPDAARCYDASSPPSSEFRPVYPATSIATSMAMTAASMAFVPPLTASYVPYASSSSSPGSSSVESGSDAKPPSTVYSSTDSNAARPARRTAATRTKRPVTAAQDASSRAQPPAGSSSADASDSQHTHSPQQQLTPAETRREKNRLRVRRHYYRKLSQMNDLRAQVSELEEKIQTLHLESASGGNSSALLLGNGGAEQQQQLTQLTQLQSYLAQLESTKRALVAENEHVRELLYTQTRQLMLARQQQQQHRVVLRPDSSQLLGALMPPPFIVKRRLAPAECDCIWQSTTRELRGLVCHRAPSATFNASGDNICGWTATRSVEDGAFKFVFQKLLHGCAAAPTLDAAWAIFRDPQRFAKLYSPSVNMWCALVQTVDDNNVVLYQEHKSMDKDDVHVVMKTILLATRIKHAHTGEFGITLRGLEHDMLKLEDLSVSERDGYEVWNDINCWLQWIPRGEYGEHCEVKVSGAIPTVGSNAYFWMVEVLLIVMRLEAATASSANLFNVL